MNFLDYFIELSRIPRSSGNETAAVDYIAAVADKYGLWYCRDGHNNILVRKNNNSEKTVMLQGHTDMVCQKDDGVDIDFLNQGIECLEDGDYLTANGTTLGADDGIAVAYMLDLLTKTDNNLPNLECLFTSDEEVGMTGASSFDYSKIKSKMLINLDSEDEGVCVCGCAGGARAVFDCKFDLITEFNRVYSLELSNLCGGHSGVDIDKGVANATVMLSALLAEMYNTEPFNLISFVGGDKDNAIPRSAKAVFTAFDIDIYKPIIERFISENKITLSKLDRKFKLRLNKHRHIGEMLTFADTHRIINLPLLIQNGVIEKSADIENFVSTSASLGVFNCSGGKLHSVSLVRSCYDASIEKVILKSKALSRLLDFDFSIMGRYPSWKYNEKSSLREIYNECYIENYGKSPSFDVIHAGLECGIIYSAIPDIDIISIGPQIDFIHSPRERLSVSSANRTYNLLKEMLYKILLN